MNKLEELAALGCLSEIHGQRSARDAHTSTRTTQVRRHALLRSPSNANLLRPR